MKNEKQIFLQGEEDAHHHGPFTEQEIRRYWAYGVVKDGDWVWHEGMSEFAQVKDFFSTDSKRKSVMVSHPTLARRVMALRKMKDKLAGVPDNSWILQVFAWLGALAATVCFLSLPATLWLPIILYVASLALLVWFIWIKKSAAAWVSLGVNVALMMTVIFYHSHISSKDDASSALMFKIPAKTAPAVSE